MGKPVWHQSCYNAKYSKSHAGFQARWDGTCHICGGRVNKGDRIGWPRNGKPRAPTNEAPVNTAPEQDETSETPEQDDVDDQHVAPNPAPVSIDESDTIAKALARALLPLVEERINAKLEGLDPEALLSKADELIQRKVDALTLPRTIEIKQVDREPVNVGMCHKQFPELMALIASGCHVAIIGEAGTGKTYAAEQVFKALSRGYNLIQAVTDRHTEVYGFIDAHGNYHPSRVYDSFGDREADDPGKGLIVDEADGSDERELLSLNAATANGCMAFPKGMRRCGKDFQVIMNMNTWGTGATAEFTGRARLDASSLDRFVLLYWEIDEDLEKATCRDAEWCAYVQAVRARVKGRGLKHLVTPRASYKGAEVIASAMAQGMTREQAVSLATRTCLKRNLTSEQWNSVK